MIYSIVISPIEFLIDWAFNFIINKLPQVGIIGAIFGVSFLVNFFALPLYNIADSIQERERMQNKKMAPQLKRIKEAFKGDEQFMMIQTYYRECNYHPLFVLRGSLSILIEVPFFIAAYHYLSNCDLLAAGHFLLFRNLSKPDELFSFLGFKVNILPIFMTLINLFSGFIYSKGALLREKIQVVVIPLIFLALLYTSPSGLVIYWILNNIFSLIKNIVLKSKNPGRVAYAFITPLLCIICVLLSLHIESLSKKSFVLFVAVISLAFPIVFNFAKSLIKKNSYHIEFQSSTKQAALLLLSGLSLAVFSGILLPSRMIATSPQEFSYIGAISSPFHYILTSFSVFLGFFVFWPLCIFKMFSTKVRFFLPYIVFTLFLISLLNVFIFSHDYGTVSLSFTISDVTSLRLIPFWKRIIPYIAAAIVIFIVFTVKNKIDVLSSAAFILLFSEIIFSSVKLMYIKKEFNKIPLPLAKETSPTDRANEFKPVIHLSKTDKNVVVLFLDRAEGSFVPYISKTLPKLKNQFAGFVYYPNTVSFSTFTIPASPAMLGGYEYTQEASNLRSDELLKDKHNEALKVMPKLFTDGGFYATVIEPIYPNYIYKGEGKVFNSIKNLSVIEIPDLYSSNYRNEVLHNDYSQNIQEVITDKEIKNFSVLQMLFPNLRSIFYKLCRDNRVYTEYNPELFISQFAHLYYLKRLTDFDSKNKTFTFFGNETTHSPVNLDDSFERPIDYNYFHKDYGPIDAVGISHYKVNCASLKAVGAWLDYLRDNDCYDNTRIIIVSDHGAPIDSIDFRNFGTIPSRVAANLNCLLLFKDFNAKGEMQTDYNFMTNADTLFLAKQNLNLSDRNPYTKKVFNQDKENGVNVYLPTSQEWNNRQLMNKTKFTLDPEIGWHIKNSIYDKNNWQNLQTGNK